MDNSPGGNAGKRTHPHAAAPAPASACATRLDLEPNHQGAATAATAPQVLPTCRSLRWRIVSPHGRAQPVPRSTSIRPARFRRKVSAGWPQSAAQSEQSAYTRTPYRLLPAPDIDQTNKEQLRRAKQETYFLRWRELFRRLHVNALQG